MGPQSALDGLINQAQAADLPPQEILDLISFHEGRERRVYTDSEGFLTVGVGFNLDRAGARGTIERLGVNFDDLRAGRVELTDSQIDQLLVQDVVNVRRHIPRIFPQFSTFHPSRQAALTDMLFNLGPTRFRGFEQMIKAVNRGDWEKAAEEAQDSKWYNQVGRRGPRIVEMLRNG